MAGGKRVTIHELVAKRMTPKAALAEAIRRWGRTGAVKNKGQCWLLTEGKHAGQCSGYLDRHPQDCKGGSPRCTVGRIELGLFFCVRGSGRSFAEAFADADLMAAKDRSEFCRSKSTHNERRRCNRCKYRGPNGREWWGRLQADGTLLSVPAPEKPVATP